MTPRTLPSLRARLALAVGLASLAGGCIFVVPSPPEFGEHCRFDGGGTPCEECLLRVCQKEIDEDCASVIDEAREALGRIETCAKKGDVSCVDVRSIYSATSTCLASSCSSVCRAKTGTSVTSCTASGAGTSGGTCTCKKSDTPNETECTDAIAPSAVCCAPTRYLEDKDLSCTCGAPEPSACLETSLGCVCAPEYAGRPNAKPSCTLRTDDETSCCLEDGKCTCQSATDHYCSSTDRRTTCTAALVGCPAGTSAYGNCSVRLP